MATTPQFTQSELLGAGTAPWTSLQFGPDGRLYAAQEDGTLLAFTIEATDAGYEVVATETINLIKEIVNFNDDGALAPSEFQGSRLTTGILVAGTAEQPVIYVSSSDPDTRGVGGGDFNLDTNSGVISRLTLTGDGWERVDLVRGLPRSEGNHAINGLQISEDGETLYLAAGGNTAMGAPSNYLGYLPEYALSAAILEIDLDAIEAMPTGTDEHGQDYKFNLPTLPPGPDDPFPDDPFGGRDGLSQAIIDPDGPVQVFAPGFRNAYDLVLTEAGKLYATDNSSDEGQGGPPTGEGPPEDGQSTATNAPNDDGFDTDEQLHLVAEGVHAGHPNPIRANPEGAGLHLDGSSTPLEELPEGWPPVPEANPAEGDFLIPGEEDGALHTWDVSVNGITEYTASEFGGAMQGDLLTVSLFDGHVYRVELEDEGEAVAEVTQLTAEAGGVEGGGLPLDITAQGDDAVFTGTIWVANYNGGITVLTPEDADGDGEDSQPESSWDRDLLAAQEGAELAGIGWGTVAAQVLAKAEATAGWHL